MANTYVLGKGKLWFDPWNTSNLTTGERAFGNCPGFEIGVTTNPLEHFSSESGIQEKDDEVLLSVVRNATINCDNINIANLELFVIGGSATLVQASGSVVDESLTVKKGRTYQLGRSASFPIGLRNLSAVVVTHSTGSPTYTATTDYTVDLVAGRLTIVAAGAIADDQIILVDYTKASKSWIQVNSQSLTAITGALRFVADNPKGPNRDLYAPKTNLRPNGTFQWIGENWLQMSFNAEFLKKDTDTAQLYIQDSAVA